MPMLTLWTVLWSFMPWSSFCLDKLMICIEQLRQHYQSKLLIDYLAYKNQFANSICFNILTEMSSSPLALMPPRKIR